MTSTKQVELVDFPLLNWQCGVRTTVSLYSCLMYVDRYGCKAKRING